MAFCGVTEEPILHSIGGIAGGKGSFFDRRQLEARYVSVWVTNGGLQETHPRAQHARPGVGGSAGEDSVVVFGKALRFHQRFAPAVGTGVEVRGLWGLAVVSLNHVFGPLRGQVDGAPAEVGNLFRMAVGPTGIFAICLVAGIGARGGVAAAQVDGQRWVSDGSGKSAIANAEKALVPLFFRQPDFESNV